MAETSQEWYDGISRRIADFGHREQDPSQWKSWPWDEEYVVRPLAAPEVEPPRGGAGGVDCLTCQVVDDEASLLPGVMTSQSSHGSTGAHRCLSRPS